MAVVTGYHCHWRWRPTLGKVHKSYLAFRAVCIRFCTAHSNLYVACAFWLESVCIWGDFNLMRLVVTVCCKYHMERHVKCGTCEHGSVNRSMPFADTHRGNQWSTKEPRLRPLEGGAALSDEEVHVWIRCICISANRLWQVADLLTITSSLQSPQRVQATNISCLNHQPIGLSHDWSKGRVSSAVSARSFKKLSTTLVHCNGWGEASTN